MSATPLLRQPLATALAGVLLVLGVSGAAWASASADPGPTRQTQTQTAPR